MIRRPLAAGALLAGVALLSACGGSTPSSTTTTDNAAAQPSAAPSVTPSASPTASAPVYTGDQAAEYDVSNLWVAVATWYVDNDGAPPAVVVLDGRYLVDGDDVGPVTPNVQFGGITGTGPDDWCVWVTNPLGDLKDFQEPAAGGFAPGKCAG